MPCRYMALKDRWELLKHLKSPQEICNVQPIAQTSWGVESGDERCSPVDPAGGDSSGRSPKEERAYDVKSHLEHLIFLSKYCCVHFRRQLDMLRTL